MASKGKSRWADSEEDAALEIKQKKEKEEKKRLKAERARQEAERQNAAAAAQPPSQHEAHQEDDQRPTKRRRLTPERDGAEAAPAAPSTGSTSTLLRFSGAAIGRCRSVDEYDKLNDIEEGAYGWVSRAREIKTGKVVALKRLKIDPRDRGGLPLTGLREIQILKDCEHRNVLHMQEVVVGDSSKSIENVFLVLDFIEHDLKSILDDMPEPFLASEVKTLLLQLAAGVAYLHDNWILHRDLKTSNLLLNNRGRLRIADFGMARYAGDPPPPNLTQLVVTLWYRGPELLLGASTYGAAVDMWSVGCIFGELLTREPLLQGKNEVGQLGLIFELCGVPTETSWPGFRRLPNARGLRLPAPSQRQPGIRARFPLLTTAGSALLASLLSLDPARRPTAKEMLDHEYFRQDPRPKQEAMFPTFPSKAGQERRRKRDTPNAPIRGQQAATLGAVDFTGLFGGREKEERGGGFSLRMV